MNFAIVTIGLDGTLAVLIKSERFGKMSEPTQQTVIQTAKARAAELRGGQ